MDGQQFNDTIKKVMPFIKPIYEKLREDGFTMEDCLSVYQTAIRICMADELTTNLL